MPSEPQGEATGVRRLHPASLNYENAKPSKYHVWPVNAAARDALYKKSSRVVWKSSWTQ